MNCAVRLSGVAETSKAACVQYRCANRRTVTLDILNADMPSHITYKSVEDWILASTFLPAVLLKNNNK